jgi:hypothetical protein
VGEGKEKKPAKTTCSSAVLQKNYIIIIPIPHGTDAFCLTLKGSNIEKTASLQRKML